MLLKNIIRWRLQVTFPCHVSRGFEEVNFKEYITVYTVVLILSTHSILETDIYHTSENNFASVVFNLPKISSSLYKSLLTKDLNLLSEWLQAPQVFQVENHTTSQQSLWNWWQNYPLHSATFHLPVCSSLKSETRREKQGFTGQFNTNYDFYRQGVKVPQTGPFADSQPVGRRCYPQGVQ